MKLIQLENGIQMWALSLSKYMQEAIYNTEISVKENFPKFGKYMCVTPNLFPTILSTRAGHVPRAAT